MKNILRNILLACFILAQVYFIKTYLIGFYKVSSNSMSPTLKKGDILLISKANYNFLNYEINEPEIGDITVFFHNEKSLIKRIVAKHPDTYFISKNGSFSLREKTQNEKIDLQIHSNKIQEDYYFMAGDNKSNSYDSRKFGLIPQDSIIGKMIFKI